MNTIPSKAAARSAAWPLGSSLAILGLAGAVHAQFYAVTDLGTLGGTNAMAYGINDHEQIVGTAQTEMGTSHAFLFDRGRMIDFGTLGGSNSLAYGINGNGWVAGAAQLSASNMHAFLCTNVLANAIMLDLGTLGGSNSGAWMVNMHGGVVGWTAMTNGSHHAFFMTNYLPGQMMDLGTGAGTNSEAYCINSNGMAVGYAMMLDGSAQPIMYTNAMFGSGTMMMLGMGNMGASGGQSWFVNDVGDSVGQAQFPGGNHHAFASGDGGMMGHMNMDLGTLGGTNSVAYCINNAGTIVGMAQLSNGVHHAFMVTNAWGGPFSMVDLNNLIPTNSGWTLMETRGVNASGQMIGWGMHAGHTNAFLMTPASAPIMMVSGPSAQIVGPGTPVVLQTQMSASEPLTYQWLHDGMPISGATNATLTLPAMSTGTAGEYTVAVRNDVGTVGSSSAALSMFSIYFSAGTPHLAVAAPAGSHFRIDYSDLLGPGASWQVMTNFTAMGSMIQMSAAAPQGSHARFYRAAMIP